LHWHTACDVEVQANTCVCVVLSHAVHEAHTGFRGVEDWEAAVA